MESSFGRKEILFTICRYAVYALQVAKGFALAYFLGPFFLGIYGYIMLYQQYLVYSNLGVQYALNAELSTTKNDQEHKDKIANSAFSLTAYIAIGLLLCAFCIYFFKIEIFPFKESYNYAFILVLITILGHFQEIYINIFRLNKNLLPIICSEFFVAVVTVSVVPFFKGVDLINAVFISWILALTVSMVIYKIIYKTKIKYDSTLIKPLIYAGIPLVLFIFSYNLMALSTRTLITIFYTTEEMGYFSFTNSLTTAIMLSFNSITWIIFPSIIAKLGDQELLGEQLKDYLVGFSKKLVIIVLLIVCLALILMPILFVFLPKYEPVEGALSVLLLNQVVFNAGFGFVSLAIGRKLNSQIVVISFLSVLACGIFGLAFSYFHLPIVWLAISNLLGSMCFLNIFIHFIARKYDLNYKQLLHSFSVVNQLAVLLCCVAAVLNLIWLVIAIITLTLFINRKDCIDIFYQAKAGIVKKKVKDDVL